MTLNELIDEFTKEGLSFDTDIEFFTGPNQPAEVLSIYESQDGIPVIDIGQEDY